MRLVHEAGIWYNSAHFPSCKESKTLLTPSWFLPSYFPKKFPCDVLHLRPLTRMCFPAVIHKSPYWLVKPALEDHMVRRSRWNLPVGELEKRRRLFKITEWQFLCVYLPRYISARRPRDKRECHYTCNINKPKANTSLSFVGLELVGMLSQPINRSGAIKRVVPFGSEELSDEAINPSA